MLHLLSAIGSILLIDIVLSGDNALVVGAAAAGLSRKQRRSAILAGGAGAVVLRILFATLASFLLYLPWLQAIGGLVLLIIAIRLLLDRQPDAPDKADETKQAEAKTPNFLSAIFTIILADLTMSLDNVLAVGALAHGDFLALSLGILLSVSILLIGSAIVAELIKWLPWLIDAAALVLAWTSANMLLNDDRLGDVLNDYPWTPLVVPAVLIGIVAAADAFLRWREWRARKLAHAS